MAHIHQFFLILAFICNFIFIIQAQSYESIVAKTAYPTVTVRGFLNFRTTVDGTVIVFTPSSTPEQTAVQPQVTKPPTIQPTKPINIIKPTSTLSLQQPDHFEKPSSIQSVQTYPTGLVTILGNTIVNQGLTTELETKVYGTYINGKYAQILKSSSKINEQSSFSSPVYINPTKSFNLKSIQATSLNKDNFKQLINQKNDLKIKKDLNLQNNNVKEDTSDKNNSIIKRNRLNRFGINSGRFQYVPRQQPKVRLNRFKAKPQVTTQKMKEEEEAAKQINQRFHKRLGLNKSQLLTLNQAQNNKNEFTNLEHTTMDQQHKRHVDFDINEELDTIPSGQQFKISKPQMNKLQEAAFENLDFSQANIKPSFSSAFIANELSTDDLNELKSDNLRTVSSSFNTQLNDLFSPVGDDEMQENQIHGTPPIVITKTYSVTESTQITSVVPKFVGTSLINQTITESFIIRKFITAFKTLPPGDLIMLETEDASSVPKLNETYTFGNLHLLSSIKPTSVSSNNLVSETSENPFLNKIDLNNPLILRATLQNPKLAAIYFGLQQLQQQATTYDVITKPTTHLTSSLVHHTKRISFYDGRQTRTRYLTDSGAYVTSTITTLTTETIPVINSQALSHQKKLKELFASEIMIQNTALPSLIQTPNVETKSNGESLQTLASNDQTQNSVIKPESSLNIETKKQNENLKQNLPSQQNNLQSSFNQIANSIPNFIQASQQSISNTNILPPLTNLQNIAPFLNPNANLNEVANILDNLQKNKIQNNLMPTRVGTTTYTSESMITKTSTKIYTLIYNGFSTKYRTVTSTSIYPTTITHTTTVVANTINPIDFNSFFG